MPMPNSLNRRSQSTPLHRKGHGPEGGCQIFPSGAFSSSLLRKKPSRYDRGRRRPSKNPPSSLRNWSPLPPLKFVFSYPKRFSFSNTTFLTSLIIIQFWLTIKLHLLYAFYHEIEFSSSIINTGLLIPPRAPPLLSCFQIRIFF